MSGESATEGDLPTAQKTAEMEGFTIWFRIHGLLERMQALMTRRHPGGRGRLSEADKLRRVEEVVEREGPWHITSYRERGSGGGREGSWQKYILGITAALLIGMVSWGLSKLDTLTQEVATLQATQTVGFAAMAQRQTADEQRLDRMEAHVYRQPP